MAISLAREGKIRWGTCDKAGTPTCFFIFSLVIRFANTYRYAGLTSDIKFIEDNHNDAEHLEIHNFSEREIITVRLAQRFASRSAIII